MLKKVLRTLALTASCAITAALTMVHPGASHQRAQSPKIRLLTRFDMAKLIGGTIFQACNYTTQCWDGCHKSNVGTFSSWQYISTTQYKMCGNAVYTLCSNNQSTACVRYNYQDLECSVGGVFAGTTTSYLCSFVLP